MIQTKAILLDAYRELNARKLFWITLILSGVVVAVFALVGINEEGLKVIVWTIPDVITTEMMAEQTFYKVVFINLGIGFWLAWIAAILALVSTASIFPDFIAGGSIDLALSKPIGRWRLFLTKYFSGLLFVALQVGVFCVGSFLILGLKGNTWEPGIFLAIPIVVIFFSYLYSVCVLLGVMTRSTIASLILTLIFWVFIFAVHSTESFILFFKEAGEQRVEAIERFISVDQASLDRLTNSDRPTDASYVNQIEERIEERTAERDHTAGNLDTLTTAHNISLAVKTVLPKTAETIGLLDRWLIDMSEYEMGMDETPPNGSETGDFQVSQDEASLEMARELRERSVWWIMGTSLLFEAVVLAFAGWRFSRRDF